MKILVAFVSVVWVGSVLAASPSSYVGEESRSIKALSDLDQADLLAGKGMGMAKAAELNGYPGPSHVLELVAELSLTEKQKTATEALYKSMQERAQAVGRELVAAEAAMDELFVAKKITAEQLHISLARIGELQSRLRGVHLEAHLSQTQLLSPEQIALYQKLRGYADGGGHQHSAGNHHH